MQVNIQVVSHLENVCILTYKLCHIWNFRHSALFVSKIAQMGQNFSTRQDHYVNRFSTPKVIESQNTFSIRGVVIPGETHLTFSNGKRVINPFVDIISQKDEEHSVIIIGIYILYISNETNHDVRINVSSLFVGSQLNKDIPHTDDIGSLIILCPARFNGPVLGMDRILYRPRLCDSVLCAYAGMEDAIMTQPIGEEPLILDITHPLAYFIAQSEKELEPTHWDFHKNPKSDTYYIGAEFAKRAQVFFKSKIYDDVHKTRFIDTRVECQLPKPLLEETRAIKNDALAPNVTCIIQVTYLSILPGQPKINVMEVKAF